MKSFLFLFLQTIIILAVVFGIVLAPHGWYEPFTGTIYCHTRLECLHEVGHKADSHSGNISQTGQYKNAVDVYRVMMLVYPHLRDSRWLEIVEYPGIGSLKWQNVNPFTISFWDGGWGGRRELYADMLAWYGNENSLPTELHDFYDWKYISTEMEKLGYGIH